MKALLLGSKKNKILLNICSISMITLIAVIPIFRGYIANTGESLLWCLRFSKIFSIEYAENICCFAVMILRIGIVLASYFFYRELTNDSEDYFCPIFGMAMLLFSPYQLYIAYDKVDLSDMLLWIIIILFSTLLHVITRYFKKRKIPVAVLIIVIEGILLIMVGLTYSVSFSTGGQLSFETKGYVFGELFTSFFYQQDHPGLGISLLFSIGVWLYYIFSVQKSDVRLREKETIGYFIIGIIFLSMSLVDFPWDVLTRNYTLMEKLINKIESPTIFLGLASFCLSVPAVKGIKYARESKKEYISNLIPGMLIFCSFAVGLFIISEYMYWQYPLNFVNM